MTAVPATVPGIGLAELTERAGLQTRFDRKYILPRAEAEALLPELAERARVLRIDGAHAFRYRSVYFDTPDLTSFRQTVNRRRRRFKVRTRSYLDSGSCWLEVKTEGFRGGTVKNRLPYRLDDQVDVAPGRWFVDSVLNGLSVDCAGLAFAPVLVSRYLRTTLYLPAAQTRVTIDVDLGWEHDGQDGHDGPSRLALPGVAVVETKTGTGASPADRLLWRRGHRPTSISKYATGLAALRPDLPAAPWRRTLRRYFTPSEAQD
jgi:hypothetical protein